MSWWNKEKAAPVHPVRVYVVDLYYKDKEVIRAAVTGLYAKIGDGVEVDADIIEIGRYADDTHGVRSIDLDYHGALGLLLQCRAYYGDVGFLAYLEEEDLRAVSIVGFLDWDLGKKTQ